MSHTSVSLPVFGAANQSGQTSGQSMEQWSGQENGTDSMDFDLLAEYLLDDNPATSGGIGLDFSINGSGIVSPEQSDDGSMPRSHDAQTSQPVAQVKHLINQHAANVASQQQQQQQQPQQQQPSGIPLMQGQALLAPMQAMGGSVSLASAPAPNAAVTQNIPAPIQPAMTNMSVAAPNSMTSTQMMQQSMMAANAAKRRRVDGNDGAPAPAVLADPAAVAAALQGRGRKKTQAQIDRRRERNRILARRTRLRKKFFFESLQKEVMDLQRENAVLKSIVRENLKGDEGQRILSECDAAEKMSPAVLEACGDQAKEMAQQDFNLVRSIQGSQHSFVITDPSLQDNPIVFASDDFLNVTGYSREDVLGRNCRFLQGTETSQEKVKEISKGLATGDDVSVTLINYTADGTPFWNKLFIAALRDAQNNIVNYIGVIVKVAGPEPSDPEHGKLLPGEQDTTAADDMDYGADGDADFNGDSSTSVIDAAIAAAPPST